MIDNQQQSVRKAATEGLINFAEFTEGIDTILEK